LDLETTRDLDLQLSWISRMLVHQKLRILMATTIDAPRQWVENIAILRLPEQADRHLQNLMDRNNEGVLTDQEREDLAALAELSERLSLVRAEALVLLGSKP
jgi:hypothetical protein